MAQKEKDRWQSNEILLSLLCEGFDDLLDALKTMIP